MVEVEEWEGAGLEEVLVVRMAGQILCLEITTVMVAPEEDLEVVEVDSVGKEEEVLVEEEGVDSVEEEVVLEGLVVAVEVDLVEIRRSSVKTDQEGLVAGMVGVLEREGLGLEEASEVLVTVEVGADSEVDSVPVGALEEGLVGLILVTMTGLKKHSK